MASRTEVSLASFFVFNSKFGPKEGDEELKILYYHPEDNHIDTKVKEVGLCEAIIKFTNTFTGQSNEVENLQTEKTLQLFLQPEPDFWTILTLNVPCEKVLKDGVQTDEYRGDEVQPGVFKALLRHLYEGFRMLHGGLDGFSRTRDQLCEILSLHFDRALKKVDLGPEVVDLWGSVQYLPVNQDHFLKIQTFVNLVEATFEGQIENSVFLFSNQVVWSGLTPENLFTFYSWLQRAVFPKLAVAGIQGDLVNSFQSSQYGNFVLGPRSMNALMPIRPIFFTEFGVDRKYDLVVFRALNCVLCLFVSTENTEMRDEELHPSFYEELANVIGPQMTTISAELGEFQEGLAKDKDPTEPSFKYLFFNELTLKHEGSVRGSNVPLEIMNIVADLYEGKSEGSAGEEVIVKTHNDFWIVRKSSNFRHHFLVLNKASSTLIDITREARKITDQHIRSIFFDKHSEPE